MQFFKQAMVAFCMVAAVAKAHATLIVDTGPGAGSNLGLGTFQSLAGKFSTTQGWAINAVQGWIGDQQSGGGSTATVAIYSDTGLAPGAALFAQEFVTSGAGPAWQGASALDWWLPAGDYWAVFEVRPGQTLFGGYMPTPVVSPIPSAYSISLNFYEWFPGEPIGVRIQASEASVPVPATLYLLGFALLMFSRRPLGLK